MSSPVVSVVIPHAGREADDRVAREAMTRYLESTGLPFEILQPPESTYGNFLRRAVAEAHGDVIVIVDGTVPHPFSAIGDAVAMIQSGATDIVFAAPGLDETKAPFLLRWLLVPILPDPHVKLKAFSAAAACLAIGESKLENEECDLEIAYLANKYGFRVERLGVQETSGRGFGLRGVIAALKVRYHDRQMAYRGPRRCPVCFSAEVWSCAQIPGNIVRSCSRCKCRYLNRFETADEGMPVHRVLLPHPAAVDPGEDTVVRTARQKTSQRRLAILRRQLPVRARVLEVGVSESSFGVAACRELEYVGIDNGEVNARNARARGLEVYCANLGTFVNTGPAFDAVVLFHIFEDMPDPHDALVRIRELLKPGGLIFLTTFDTEGLIYLLTERKRMAYNFRSHLILYSRSALIELLERSGFEIDTINPDFEYRDHKFLKHWAINRWPRVAAMVPSLVRVLPNPVVASSGSIRIMARRRAGSPLNIRTIRAAEPTHAR